MGRYVATSGDASEVVTDGDTVNVALARRLGVPEAAVRSLVNPDHASRHDDLVEALSVLGRGLTIEGQKQVAVQGWGVERIAGH